MPPTSPLSPDEAARRASAAMPAGTWPSTAADIPPFLSPQQLATLLGRSQRSLERDRASGRGVPYCKFGRQILYQRDDVLAHLAASRFTSTQQAKAARAA